MTPLVMQIQSPSPLLTPVVVEITWESTDVFDHYDPTEPRQKHELRIHCRSHPEASDSRPVWLKAGEVPSWDFAARDVAAAVWLDQLSTWFQRLAAAEQGVLDRHTRPLLVSPLEKEEDKKGKKK